MSNILEQVGYKHDAEGRGRGREGQTGDLLQAFFIVCHFLLVLRHLGQAVHKDTRNWLDTYFLNTYPSICNVDNILLYMWDIPWLKLL